MEKVKFIFNKISNVTYARVSKKCNDCNRYSSCGVGECPLYYFKNNQARCMKFKNCMDELLKIIELQGHYDLTLSLEDK